MTKISKYLTYAEATDSATARKHNVSNEPDAEQLANMKHVAVNIFDKVREHIGGALHASSFFRSYDVNNKLGLASKTSQHMKGEAIDITTKRYNIGTNKQVFEFIRKNLVFDQMIWEFGDDNEPDWVHVSLKRTGGNRHQTLRAYKTYNANNPVQYKPF